MIKLIDLCKNYDFEVLQNINIELPNKGFVAIVGESGSGKSTLLKCIGILEKPTSGQIYYGDKELFSLDYLKKESVRGRIFSYIPQNVSLIEDETVDNGLSFFHPDPQRRTEVLKRLGIADKKDEIARNLSGGERQKVAIAQALLRDAPVILCDEITANLDPKNALQVYEILKEISMDKLVLCVGHDPKLLADYADRMIALEGGKIESDKTFTQETDKKDNFATANHANRTSLGAVKFFKIFTYGIKSKIARIVFATLFLFLSMSGLCFGITQQISGYDGLIRKQADLLGVEFVKIDEYQQGSYFAVNTTALNFWHIFVDFDKEKEHFELIEGDFPSNDCEVLISQFQAEFENIEVGDETYVIYDEVYKVSGIFKSDVAAYKFKTVPEDYIPYATLTAKYFSIDSLPYYEEHAFKSSIANEQGVLLCRYGNEPLIAGRQIDDNAKDEELMVSTGYISYAYGYDSEKVKADPQSYFDKIDKHINFNGHDFTVVGLCDYDFTNVLYKKGSCIYLSGTAGYIMPIDEVNKNNISTHFDLISRARSLNTNLSKIGIPLFAVFAVLSMIVFINLNFYETDERKILFRNMRQAGFSKLSLSAYELVADLFIFAIAIVLFFIVGLPIISHFQIVQCEYDAIYVYALNGWAAIVALVSTAVLTVLSYLITYRKFDKEISECSRS